MARSITVVTTFSDAGWEQYGKRFVETFTQHWPQDIKLKEGVAIGEVKIMIIMYGEGYISLCQY